MPSTRPASIAFLTFLILSTAGFSAESRPAADQPTWSGEVAAILHENCVQCHSPGQSAPMSLRTYREARPWARSIGRNVQAGEMPPWHASGGIARFANDRSLTEAEIDAIVRWTRAGAPAGDLASAPEPPPGPSGEWKLGEPDFVVQFEEVEIPADGPDQFRDLVGKVALPEDRWITAVEILPGNAKVVHHVITYRMKGFDFDPTQGWIGAWAAGTDPMVFPEGTGRLLPKGSNLIADMHYHPAGTPETDATRIGLHFADEPPGKELTNIWIQNDGFRIPAGAEDHEVRASKRFWQSGRIMGLIPHMHYRGKDFEYVAHFPDGRQETLLEVADYDFAWQTSYVLSEPIDIPAGTVVEAIAHYDNSADNPDNPDPTVDVTFGLESYDEMMIGFIDFVVDEGVRPMSALQLRSARIGELAAEHPGDVFEVSARPEEERNEPDAYAPIHLPREGDGVFYIVYSGNLMDAAVSSILWDGDRFTAEVDSPMGPLPLEGTVSGDEAEVTLTIPGGDDEPQKITWTGSRVEG